MTTTEKDKKVFMASAVGNSLGMAGGLLYAFKKGKGFWGYVGYGLLFAIIGGTLTGVPAYVLIEEDKVKEEDKGIVEKPRN